MDKITDTIIAVKENAKGNLVPIVRDKTLEALLNTCRQIEAKIVLEIGTATGYSALNLLTVAERLTTIEKNQTRFQEAKENFEKAEVSDRVKQILGDASEVLENLAKDGKKFDLIFLDGPKGQYVRYLPNIKKLLNNGGVLFADNILLGGLIKNEMAVTHKNRAMFNNMKAFWKEIQSSEDFKTTIYEIEDGFAISIKQ